MKNIKLIIMVLCVLSMLSGCVLFSKNAGKGSTGKKENSVSGGKK